MTVTRRSMSLTRRRRIRIDWLTVRRRRDWLTVRSRTGWRVTLWFDGEGCDAYTKGYEGDKPYNDERRLRRRHVVSHFSIDKK